MLTTSLNEIKSYNPCVSGWEDVLKGQGKTEPDDVQFSLVSCVDSNSISDVLWLLGERKKEIQIAIDFAKWCAESCKHLKDNSNADAAAIYADIVTDSADSAAYSASAASRAAVDATAALADAAAYDAAYDAYDAACYAATVAAYDAARTARTARATAIKQQKEKLKELILNFNKKEQHENQKY